MRAEPMKFLGLMWRSRLQSRSGFAVTAFALHLHCAADLSRGAPLAFKAARHHLGPIP
jgi:hypothetical protein